MLGKVIPAGIHDMGVVMTCGTIEKLGINKELLPWEAALFMKP